MSAQIALHHANVAGLTTGRWLTPLRDPWPIAATRLLADQPAVVRVVLVDKRGSAPRDAGSCMLVTQRDLLGTIGGGHLEWEALHRAHIMLDDTQADGIQVRRLILGQELAQCCGGAVHLWLERFTRDDLSWLRRISNLGRDPDAPLLVTQSKGAEIKRTLQHPNLLPFPAKNFASGIHFTTDDGNTLIERLSVRRPALWLYGAGHVGQALVRLLADLPMDITWIDTRAEFLPNDLPSNVRVKLTHAPLELARSAPAVAHHRVLTHDHGLDYALCRELLDGDFASLGVIGSASKAAKFRARLKRDGVAPERVAALLCPIGISMPSKEPVAIAIGIAAQLLQQQAGVTQKERDRLDVNMKIFADTCDDKSCSDCRAKRATK